MFSHICQTYYPLCFLVVHMYPSVMRSSWHFSSSGFNIRFPRTPQNENKNLKKCSSDYFHILHIVELWCDFKKFVGPWSIYIFIKCLWVLLTNVFWFRATGGYICGCGRPSNLVLTVFEGFNGISVCFPVSISHSHVTLERRQPLNYFSFLHWSILMDF